MGVHHPTRENESDRSAPTEKSGSTPASPSPSAASLESDATNEIERRRERNRLAERKSRLTRLANRERMAEHVKTLECVLANYMFVGEDSEATSWSDLVLDDDESKRVRAFLRRLAPLEAEKARLQSEQHELKQLLCDREAFEDVFRGLVQEINKEHDWEWRVVRWRALTRASFVPWMQEQCDAVIENTLAFMTGFMADDGVVTTGLTFLGWRDRRRLDNTTGMMEFSFYKTCHGNVDVINDELWKLHRPGKAYADVIVGRNAKVYTEIIQEFNHNCCLVRAAELYEGMPMVMHTIVMLIRVYIGDACYIVRRTVSAPEVVEALSDPDAFWAPTYYWTSHLVLERNESNICTKYRCATYGTLSSTNQAYVIHWLSEMLFSVVRAENWIGGAQLLLT